MVAAAGGSAAPQQRREPQAAKPITPVAVSTLAERTEAYIGARVSLTGVVRQRLSPSAFSVVQGGRAGGPEILVLAGRVNGPLEPGSDVTIVGDVVRFGGSGTADRLADAAPGATAAFDGRAAIIAASVFTAAGVDLMAVGATRTAAAKAAQKDLECAFPVAARGAWKAGAPSVEAKATPLAMRFESIRVEEGTARVVAEAGQGEAIVQASGTALNFVQVFDFGALYTTTVFDWRSGASNLKAVHTRHDEFWLGQYYGNCDVKP